MKKHTKQIISGLTLFVLGGIVIPVVFCVFIFMHVLANETLAQFTIPGQAVVTIEKQGRYYLWNDYQTIFGNKTYSNSKELPGGLEISLLGKNEGIAVDFVSDQSITSSNGDSHKNSIGYFEVNEPGTYILSVSGETESRICSFGKSIFNLANVFIFIAVFGLAMLTGLTGFIFVIIGIVNLARNGKSKKPDACLSPM